MSFLFGSRKTPQEMLRQHQRSLNKTMRELDRERNKLEQQEKKLIADIKKSAKAGQIDATKIMAKDLVRTRRYSQKMMVMKTQIQAVSLKIQTLRSNQAMADAMKGTAKAMRRMNNQMKLPQMTKIMQDFERESEIMNMKEEMMGEAMDSAMEDVDDEEETDAIVNQVLDELGLNLEQSLASAPLAEAQKEPASKEKAAVIEGAGDMDADLQARLDNLRKD
eukprot:Clim_evm21s128 gene=Clim_evmTU21s128